MNRPSRLPNVANQFGQDGHFYLSARQSRFGVKGTLPTSNGDVKGQFEFDMFGVGGDAGQTTIRLRHAWGQWKQIGAGQTNSQFMDVDVFPNTLEYWGPNGMLFFRNVQVFWEPFNDGTSNARIAIEAPGASGDAGVFADRVELQNVKARFPSPDFTGHYRKGGKWGYVQVGGALRYIAYDDAADDRQVRPERPRLGLGHQHQLRPEGRRRTTCCTCSSSRARASRTTSTTRRSTSASRPIPATR